LNFNCKECGIESQQLPRGRIKKFCSSKCQVLYNRKKNESRKPTGHAWVFTGFVKIPERHFTITLDRYLDNSTLFEMRRLEASER